MTGDEYIKKLYDLRKYLKENPELIPDKHKSMYLINEKKNV